MIIPKTIISLDFETYFDADYTLRKLSTSEYIRDKRFKAHGASISINFAPAKWYSGKGLKNRLAKIDWDNVALLCHNTAFDGLILSHHYKIIPAYYLDTMSMARGLFNHSISAALGALGKYLGLGHKVPNVLDQTKGVKRPTGQLLKDLKLYCEQDVNLMNDCFVEMQYTEKFPVNEFHLIHHTIKMFCDPVIIVDIPRVETELQTLKQERRDLVMKVARITGETEHDKILKVLGSSIKFAQILKDNDIPPPEKISPTTGKWTFAFSKTDLGFRKLLLHPDPDIRDLIHARLAAKSTLPITRAERLIRYAQQGRLPILLNYCKAHTMRWSGGDKLNPQNFPAGRSGQRAELRRSLTAPDGYEIVVADSSQIEARVNAWLANQKDMLQIFATGEDVYKVMASTIYNKPYEDVTDEERFIGKIAILGLGYGMGWNKFRDTLALGTMGPAVFITELEAQRIVNIYRRKNFSIVNLWKWLGNALHRMKQGETFDYRGILEFFPGGIDMPNLLSLHYPDLRHTSDGFQYKNGRRWSKIYGGLFCENIIQCLARIIVGEQALVIGEKNRILTLSHDEIVFLAPSNEAQEALDFALSAMRIAPDWCADIPLEAKGGYDKCYSK